MSEKASKDPRFSQVYSDPRFKLPKKRDAKFDIDDRFTKDDLSLIKSTSKVDKYGRKITKKDDNTKHFDKYYKKSEEKEDESESESESESEESSGEDDADSILARARGQVESSSDEDSTDEEIEEEEAVFEEIEEHEAPESEPTKRFAAVNLDWDNINSIDLFTTFSSFLPKNGSIKNVSIFKSEYGKQKLQEEDLHGPPKELFGSAKNEVSSDDDSDEEEELDIQAAAKKLFKEDDGKADYNTKALRNYQLQRLRYFYAVIEFDSVETSETVYKLCDGTEFESTANVFDLRYIPDDMEFDNSDLKNSCNKVPNNYKPAEFSTDALRSSNIKLTWDETPNERIQLINKAFNQKDIDDMDFKAYLASDSEEGEMNEETKAKYKNLVGKKDNKNLEDSEGLEGDDIDMEITFTPGLNENVTEDKTEVVESSIDKLKNKEKERKKKRKERLKELKRETLEKKKNRNKRRDTAEEEEELVIEEDGEGDTKEVKHFNMKEIEKLEKLKSKKKKSNKQKKKERELEERIGNNEEITIEEGDDRFKEMLEGHEFVGGSKVVKNMRMKHKKREREEKKEKLSDLVKKIKKSK